MLSLLKRPFQSFKRSFNNRPLRVKFVLPMLAAMGIMLTALYLFFPNYYVKKLLETYRFESERFVDVLAVGIISALEEHRFELVAETIQTAERDPNISFISLLDANGEEIARYDHHSRQKAAAGDTLAAPAWRKPEKDMLRISRDLTVQGSIPHRLILGYSLVELNRQIRVFQAVTVLITIVSFLCGFGFISLLSRKITRPLSHLRQQMQEIVATENYATCVRAYHRDEVGELAKTFNTMMHEMQLRRKRLLESQQKYLDLYEKAPNMYFSVDMDGKILDCNQAAVAVLGQQKDRITGTLLSRYVSPPEGMSWDTMWARLSCEPTLQDVECRLKSAEGNELQVLLTSSIEPDDVNGMSGHEKGMRAGGVRIALSDISRLKAFEAEIVLRNKELQALNALILSINESLNLKTVAQRALDHIAPFFDAQRGWITLWDKSRCEVVAHRGFPSEQQAQEFFRHNDVPCGVAELCGHRRRPMEKQHEIKERTIKEAQPDGPELLLICVPLHAKGVACGSYVLLYEEKSRAGNLNRNLMISMGYEIGIAAMNARLYTELKAANEKLRELDRLKSNFVSDASHHLRTPLTIISGELQLAQRRKRKPKEYEATLAVVHDEVENLIRIVENLLTLAKGDMGALVDLQDAVDLAEICRQQLQHAALLIRQKKLRMHAQIETGCWLEGDARRLAELVFNLIENAIKYTPEEKRIWLSLKPEGDLIVLRVRDSGIGIPEEDLDKLFDRFYRGRNAMKSSSGSGLGLTICRSIVEAHQGQISVKSEVGKGSEFEVRLPRLRIDSTETMQPGERGAELAADSSGQ